MNNEFHQHRANSHNAHSVFQAVFVVASLTLLVALVIMLRSTFDPLARTQIERELYRQNAQAERLQWADDMAGIAWRLLPVVLVGAAGMVGLLAFYKRYATREMLQAQFVVNALEAQHQPGQLPTTLHYSPHTTDRSEFVRPALLPPVPPALDAITPTLPGLVDLATLNYQPTSQALLLGLGEGGEQITVPLAQLLHVATAGPTGNGKSNINRLLLAQLIAMGAKVAIGDPKWTPYDAEQDEDWRPIERRLHLAPAVDTEQIGSLLDYTQAEITRRLQLRREGKSVGTPLFIALDELPWIADHVKGSADTISELVRLGRGVKVFTITAAQDFLAKTVGMSAARDNFRSAFYLGGDLKTGSLLLDIPQRSLAELEGSLSLGVALVRSATTTPARLVRIPYVSNQALYQLLGDAPKAAAVGSVQGANERPFGFHLQPTERSAEPSTESMGSAHQRAVKPLSARAMQVRDLLAQRVGTDEIIRRVWEVERSTRAGRKAYEELQDILAELAAALTA